MRIICENAVSAQDRTQTLCSFAENNHCFGIRQRSKNIHSKKNQLDSQFIFSIFRQTPLHVSGVSIAHHQEVHCMNTIGTFVLFR